MPRIRVSNEDGLLDFGFSGSQNGMTSQQSIAVASLLVQIQQVGPYRFHIGDCVGSDEQMRQLVKNFGGRTYGHPPVDDKKRAFGEYDEMADPFPYLQRNMHIVLAGTDGFVATPATFEMPDNLRGQGTWWTIKSALQCERLMHVVLPDGRLWTPQAQGGEETTSTSTA